MIVHIYFQLYDTRMLRWCVFCVLCLEYALSFIDICRAVDLHFADTAWFSLQIVADMVNITSINKCETIVDAWRTRITTT